MKNNTDNLYVQIYVPFDLHILSRIICRKIPWNKCYRSLTETMLGWAKKSAILTVEIEVDNNMRVLGIYGLLRPKTPVKGYVCLGELNILLNSNNNNKDI